jgi:hypothetical protein
MMTPGSAMDGLQTAARPSDSEAAYRRGYHQAFVEAVELFGRDVPASWIEGHLERVRAWRERGASEGMVRPPQLDTGHWASIHPLADFRRLVVAHPDGHFDVSGPVGGIARLAMEDLESRRGPGVGVLPDGGIDLAFFADLFAVTELEAEFLFGFYLNGGVGTRVPRWQVLENIDRLIWESHPGPYCPTTLGKAEFYASLRETEADPIDPTTGEILSIDAHRGGA